MKNSALSKKLGVCWKIRLFLENQALSGKLDAFWKIRRFLENQAHSGKSGSFWKIRHFFEKWCASPETSALVSKTLHLQKIYNGACQKHVRFMRIT
jgi:hypothetical protein